uniref:Ion transport domain-containing protein n=1 Tax=Romanomermis culicivorax TaxID=13658 RepID=A0A915IDF4_ROMCU
GNYIVYETATSLKSEARKWENYKFNFNDAAKALCALFVLGTFEGWPEILYRGINSNVENHGPIRDYRQAVSLFFIAYIVVISFFMMNIFVGFVIVTFQQEGEREYANCELDKNQRKCIEYALKAKPQRRYIPTDRIRYKIWWFVTSNVFEYGILIVILCNTITLAMKVHNASNDYMETMDTINVVFTVIFTVEFILKIIAFTPTL